MGTCRRFVTTNRLPSEGSTFHTSAPEEDVTAPSTAYNQHRRRGGGRHSGGDIVKMFYKMNRNIYRYVSCEFNRSSGWEGHSGGDIVRMVCEHVTNKHVFCEARPIDGVFYTQILPAAL